MRYALTCRIIHEPIRRPLAHKMGMALDFRLNALRAAILEDWAELEADEADGALVIRVRDRGKISEARKE